MNIITSTKKIALVAGMLGVCGLGFLAPSASAKPDQDDKEYRRDVKEDHKDHHDSQHDDRDHDAVDRTRPSVHPLPRTVYGNGTNHGNGYHSGNNYGNGNRNGTNHGNGYHSGNNYGNGNHYGNGNNYGSDNRYRNGNHYRTQTTSYNGRVISVSRGRLSIDVGGSRYFVDSISGLLRGLNRGDIVRVTGTRSGNTIRNARISRVRNY